MLHRVAIDGWVVYTGDLGYQMMQDAWKKAAAEFLGEYQEKLDNGVSIEDITLPSNQAHVSSRNTFGKIP